MAEPPGFFSRDAGQARRRALSELLNEGADYFLGPTGIPDRLRLAGEFLNPVGAMEEASVQAGRAADPELEAGERLGAAGMSGMNVALLGIPGVLAARGFLPRTEAVTETLTGLGVASPSAQREVRTAFEELSPSGRVDLLDAEAPPVSSSVKLFGPDPDRPNLPNTRNQGLRFHGARSEISELSPDYIGSEGNIYGNAFYTSDAVGPASGYRRGTEEGVVYRVDEIAPVNPFNMEQPVPDWLRSELNRRPDDLLLEALEEGPRNVREFFDNVRELSPQYGLPRYEVQEIFDGLHDLFRLQGFDALDHLGGLRTTTAPHNVRMYLNPAEQIRIHKVDPADPFLDVDLGLVPPPVRSQP
jgi:hypothetical protein